MRALSRRFIIPIESIERRIYLIRGHRIMLDSDLAGLYDVSTGALNRAVKRNAIRFPSDFMFRLTLDETLASRCQIGILKRGRNIKYLPCAFTEQGVAMLSSVLKSHRAALVNIAIMRAFVKIREVLATHKDLAKRLESIERHLAGHDAELGKQAEEIRKVFEAINQLMEPPVKPTPRIGFQPQKK